MLYNKRMLFVIINIIMHKSIKLQHKCFLVWFLKKKMKKIQF